MTVNINAEIIKIEKRLLKYAFRQSRRFFLQGRRLLGSRLLGCRLLGHDLLGSGLLGGWLLLRGGGHGVRRLPRACDPDVDVVVVE